jgi:hypothetical protein
LVLALTPTALHGAAPAGRPGAAAGGTTAGASTSPAGAHVRIGFDGAYREVGSPGSSGAGGAAGGCRRRRVPEAGLTPDVATYLSVLFGPPPTPEHRPYSVYCGDAFLGPVWVLPATFAAAAGPTAAELAAELARDLPYPQVTIGVSPDGRGLTGLESWFWVDGYDGAVLRDAVSGLGATVEVEAVAGRATWDFGDGSPVAAGPVGGDPGAPAARHVYERRSDGAGFGLSATFAFSVRYRVDGGEWIALPAVARAAEREYVVIDARSQLVTDASG